MTAPTVTKPAAGHKISVYRIDLGRAAVGGGSRYGTAMCCECGWSARSNEAPPSRSRSWQNHLYTGHLANPSGTTKVLASAPDPDPEPKPIRSEAEFQREMAGFRREHYVKYINQTAAQLRELADRIEREAQPWQGRTAPYTGAAIEVQRAIRATLSNLPVDLLTDAAHETDQALAVAAALDVYTPDADIPEEGS